MLTRCKNVHQRIKPRLVAVFDRRFSATIVAENGDKLSPFPADEPVAENEYSRSFRRFRGLWTRLKAR